MPPAPERPALSRDAIVAAAREMVADAGLEALSLRRLASRLGVTAPALYAHVEGKSDLLRALAEQELDALGQRFAAVATDDPVERMRANAREYVAYARENPELFRVMFLFPPALSAAVAIPAGTELPAATRAFQSSVGAVEDAAASGRIHVEDTLLTALALWSAVHGVAVVLQLGFDFPPDLEDALVAEVTDRLLQGYGAGVEREGTGP
jgi:AcrR family transcriptional regulator